MFLNVFFDLHSLLVVLIQHSVPFHQDGLCLFASNNSSCYESQSISHPVSLRDVNQTSQLFV